MSWIRIDDHAPEHPKMLAAGPTACWLWVWGLAYANRQLTDGFIPCDAIYLSGVRNPGRFADTLMDVGLWDRVMPTETSDRDGWNIHDYHEYQPSKAQVTQKRQAALDRVKRWRYAKGNANGNSYSNADVMRVTDTAPDPDPDPSTSTRTAAPPLTPVEKSVENFPRRRDPEDAPFRVVCALVRATLHEYQAHDEADLMGELKDRCVKSGFLYDSNLLVRALNFERGKARARRTA